MALITDEPRGAEARELAELASALDAAIPARALDRNLLIGTWNIRAFGGLTPKWRSGDDDSPKRDVLALRAIAETVARFDVMAIQEVRGDIQALRHLLKVLNAHDDHWGVLLTDVTRGPAGNDERMAFVFDTRRVKPSGLACELVVPPERDDIGAGALQRQFARTPYAASFRAGAQTFILVTLHVRYGDSPQDRVWELTAIARWLADWSRDMHEWSGTHNLIALGDFNIDRRGDPLYEAFTSTGLVTPTVLDEVPRTLFGSSTDHHYDQIGWFTGDGDTPELSLAFTGRGGGFDFAPHVHRDLTRQQQSWRLSDHYPLWVEFGA